MPYIPSLRSGLTAREVTDAFYGYNHNMKIADGEFYHMENLSSDYFPLLGTRPKRGKIAALSAPCAMVGKSKLAYIDGTSLYYGGTDITEHLTAKGFTLSENLQPKTMVSMGAYLIIFPDKLYLNTEDFTDCGSLEAYFTTSGEVTYTLAMADGTDYGNPVVSPTAPAEPKDEALWMDTSCNTHVLKQYSAATAVWAEVATVYTCIHAAGIGKQFSQYDGVTISGCTAPDSAELDRQLQALNGNKIIYQKTDDTLVVVGLLDAAYTQTSGTVTVSRTVPAMDYVTQSGNRIWGCKYGLVEGKTVNEIYCCALGDAKNWSRYLGISTDSYTATVGTDGAFTGAITHLGSPIFFKENCLHKVYVSPSGAHQIVDTACRGVQQGSSNSLAVVGETLYYKSANDVCAYDGSLPHSVSEQLGAVRYHDASAGAYRDKYYLSMADESGQYHLFAYDTRKGFWHREDSTHAVQFATCGGELYYIDSDTNALMCVGGSEGELEQELPWLAQSGLMGYESVDRQYVSHFNLRMKLPQGASVDVFLEYDSDGVWHHAGHIVGTGTNTFLLPIRPRRCDHFRLRLEGVGDVRLYSLAKIHERGSDGG